MATSNSVTSINDLRALGPDKPVFEQTATFVWQTGDAHGALTATFNEVNGTIKEIVVGISEVTGNPTTTFTFTDSASRTLLTLSNLADATTHRKTAQTDFDEILVNGDLTVSVDPSADPGGEAQTLTITVTIKGV